VTSLAGAERKRIFRETAIRNAEGGTGEGDIIRISPDWTRWTYWVLVAFFLSALAYCTFGTIHEYGSGPAVVWVTGRLDVTSTVSGTVTSVEGRPGQRVEAGTPLLRFYSAREEAELSRLQHEFELQLAKSLRDPSDVAAREALTALRTQRDLAVARLDQLVVRAPQAGVIGDVRIRPGQRLAEGDIVVTLLGDRAKSSIVAMLPAQYRPQLQPGMSLRFEVTGYRYAYQEMTISSVGAQIIGPNEVKRYLGHELDDTVEVKGPVVLVEATPSSPTFVVDGQVYPFYHGMNGTAEARVRSERILFALIPGLRALIQEFSHGQPGAR
jgi:membrane fusion protein (multidrug efflux system)